MKFGSTSCPDICVKNNFINGVLKCKCGEDVCVYIWHWSEEYSSPGIRISEDKKDILFHPCFSTGTAVVRGDTSLKSNIHYYWEIKMTSKTYGTDVMVGIGTSKVEFSELALNFCSLLGIDSQSWGYSYHGNIQHNKLIRQYGSPFGLGNIIGIHLDMCKGTLEYYLNRKPLGIAFTDLKGYELYPMVSSTAAQSGIRLMCSVSEKPTLQMLCLSYISKSRLLYQQYQEIPGLKRIYDNKYFWIVPNYDDGKRQADIEDSLMCPLSYSNFLKSHKKLRTSSNESDSDNTFHQDIENSDDSILL